MEDNIQDVESTEVVADRNEPEGISIRQALQQQYDKLGGDDQEDSSESEASQPSVEEPKDSQESPPEAIPLVPPADMNKYEREAYLNPTPQNAHVLQQYLNRRAYETRSDYQRKMQELESLKAETSSIYDTVKKYEQEYAKDGISLSDITRRSIEWDKSMQTNPVQTALEWLDSYGVTLNDLSNYSSGNTQYSPEAPQQSGYLTREEAERIAEEKFNAIQDQQKQKAVEYYNERVVQSFMSSKPVFRDPETAAQLEADMTPVVAALTSTGRYSSPEEILETAYNYVINGNPTYSSVARTMSAKTEIKEQQAAVAKAKAASRSISGSPGSGTPKIQAKNLRDNLQRRLNGDD